MTTDDIPTMIALCIEDGRLSFDSAESGRHSEDLESWLESVDTEDLFCGVYYFEVPVDVTWDGDEPTLTVRETTDV